MKRNREPDGHEAMQWEDGDRPDEYDPHYELMDGTTAYAWGKTGRKMTEDALDRRPRNPGCHTVIRQVDVR